ncbi:unnamed protein product [Oppiella nova]|uniref:Protein kinase domain-containing protein n=1 Tax=Oppiella nova TaxID=334625 RepID=A0A7R9QP15_9ACAR|nr:unnamed protein product [Oppiella nova]CAG2169076.1 unnamed protein product [Oppiella nova]
MILTSDRCVYGWGFNRFGQLGCGPDSDIRKGVTFRVNFNPYHEIKEGQVYSWGLNDWHNLGHNSSGNIWKPQLIADMTVVSEVNDYKRLYEELRSLGSGAFGEVLNNYGNVCEKWKI